MEFPILVAISDTVTTCCCCGKSNLKRTIELSSSDIGQLNLGVTCCGEWFSVNLSGNPYYSARRLGNLLRNIDDDKLEDIIEEIREASKEW